MNPTFQRLRLDGVSRSFTNAEGQAVAALKGLDLDVRRGEFIALLGPSGCGKSTALNCIAGLNALSSGGIWLDDTRIDVLPPEKRGFGMVFQNYALFPHLNVIDNVGFGLRMWGLPAREIAERARKALELVQLVGHERKLPGQLSGGQQQRVAIARAIVIEPPLVLMDEPLSNLDTKLRIEMRGEIRRIHGELDRATIYVTHDQDEALSMADRIVVMREGTVQQIGTPKEVYRRPANLHVARFIGYRNVVPFDLGPVADGRATLRAVALSTTHSTTPSTTTLSEAPPHVTTTTSTTRPAATLPTTSPAAHPGAFELRGTTIGPLGPGRVSVAMRPDDFERAPHGSDNRFDAVVETVEYGGRESLLHVQAPFGPLYVRIAGEAERGETLSLRIAPDRVLVYPWEHA